MKYVADDRDMFVPTHDADGRKLSLAVREDLREALLATDLQDRTAIHAFVAEWLRIHARAPLPGTRNSSPGESLDRKE